MPTTHQQEIGSCLFLENRVALETEDPRFILFQEDGAGTASNAPERRVSKKGDERPASTRRQERSSDLPAITRNKSATGLSQDGVHRAPNKARPNRNSGQVLSVNDSLDAFVKVRPAGSPSRKPHETSQAPNSSKRLGENPSQQKASVCHLIVANVSHDETGEWWCQSVYQNSTIGRMRAQVLIFGKSISVDRNLGK
ncbi:unnamed protein product [Protopolystoma xenopodis]|uniref:Uncharacterized protein n=1 Tax=Protopolystoma xenopodis TaxID=117903 RepID=A0A448XN70_9PLAT|nr:unnamed protein product [Protopolystoma xenopodis]